MWTDNDTPGCFYDTIDCTGGCCKEGTRMYDEYCKEKVEKEKEETTPQIKESMIKKIDITEKVNWQSSWDDDEVLGLKFCPECGFDYGKDILLLSIYEDDAHECKNCHTKFVISKKITVFKIDL
jgi:hypothetical protein